MLWKKTTIKSLKFTTVLDLLLKTELAPNRERFTNQFSSPRHSTMLSSLKNLSIVTQEGEISQRSFGSRQNYLRETTHDNQCFHRQFALSNYKDSIRTHKLTPYYLWVSHTRPGTGFCWHRLCCSLWRIEQFFLLIFNHHDTMQYSLINLHLKLEETY